MFERLTLRSQIAAGYAVPVLLLIVVAVLVYTSLERASRFEASADAMREQVDAFQLLAFNLVEAQRSARGVLLGAGEAGVATYHQSLQEAAQVTDDLAARVTDPTLRDLLEELRALSDELSERDETLFVLVRAGEADEAIRQWQESPALEISERIRVALEASRERGSELLAERLAAASYATRQITRSLIWGTLAAALAALALALWTARRISYRIEEAVSTIASSSAEINATVAQQERTALQQSSAVTEVSSTMEELSSSAAQVSNQSEQTAARTREVLELAGAGRDVVRQNLERMAEVKRRSEAVSDQILRLSELTGQIGNITVLVREIAGQTNLLALNAAVEAARAGEQGKGFGVVAAEIRQLAEESRRSVERIRALVKSIQDETESTVGAAREGSRLTEENLKLAEETGETFDRVTNAMDEAFENVQQISLGVKEQALAVRQVRDTMNGLRTGVRETASGINQVKVGLERLHSTAGDLRAMT